jgi:hypothetical protein
MRLEGRVTILENRAVSKRRHLLKYLVDKNTNEEQVKKEAIEAYCEKHRLDPEKLDNEDYGKVLYIANTIIYAGDFQDAA